MEDKVLVSLIKVHGCDKIIFGTDFPWERASLLKQKIEKIINDEDVRKMIFYQNAKKILNL